MSHPRRVHKVERQSEKRAIEVARYVLPVAAFTTMVHTLSGIVLHRLRRMQAASDTPSEARLVIGEMVERVREVDPQFFDRFDNEPMQDLPEWQHPIANGEAFAREFDGRLAGLTSRLTDYSPRAMDAVAEAYRAVMGLTATDCPNAEALDRILNPARNPYRRETLDRVDRCARSIMRISPSRRKSANPAPAASHGSRFTPAADSHGHARPTTSRPC